MGLGKSALGPAMINQPGIPWFPVVNVPPDLRQFLRMPFSYRVKVVVADRILAFPQAINISLGGILVDGADRLPVGSDCGVAILLQQAEAGKRVVTRGTVVRSDAAGMAIAFSRPLEPESLQTLLSLVQAAPADPELAQLPPGQACG